MSPALSTMTSRWAVVLVVAVGPLVTDLPTAPTGHLLKLDRRARLPTVALYGDARLSRRRRPSAISCAAKIRQLASGTAITRPVTPALSLCQCQRGAMAATSRTL